MLYFFFFSFIVSGFAAVIYFIIIYNNLISIKNNVSKNWAKIAVLLKQRYNELPKLINTCKEYMQYESTNLRKIIEARKAALAAIEGRDLVALNQAEAALKSELTQLFAVVANYPELKTNTSFQKLQAHISEVETDIAHRRGLYNDSVTLNNIRMQQIPDIFIARAYHFTPFELLKFEEIEKAKK